MSASSLALRDVARRLKLAGIEEAALEARLLVAYALDCPAEQLYAVDTVPIAAGEQQALDDMIARRINREPIAYILGRQEFWSLPFKVGPGVLIPRADSETVIEAIRVARPDTNAPLRVLDLGTGSGCLLLSLLSEYPDATGIGADMSEAALAIAQDNAHALRLDARARFVKIDWRETENPLYTNLRRTRFDIIVSNPPYIADCEIDSLMPDVRCYEPETALNGGVDGLDAYRELLPLIRNCLHKPGLAVVECGAGQASQILNIARDQGFEEPYCAHDLAGIERCIVLSV